MTSFLHLCSADQFRCILKEIGTNEDALERDVQTLKKWMEKQPHLPNIQDEDIFKNLLVLSKNKMEKTKHLLHTLYMAKAKWPYLSSDRANFFDQIEDMKQITDFVLMPRITPDGDRVVVFRLKKHRPEDLPSWEFVLKCGLLAIELAIKIDSFRRVTIIMDLENMSSALASLGLSVITKAPVLVAAKHIPARCGNIYVLNLHPAFHGLFSFLNNVIKPKIMNKIVIWDKKRELLAQEIPRNCLPADFGGTEKSLTELCDEFFEDTKQFRDYVINVADIKADLNKVPAKYEFKENEIDVGIPGSFRNLLIE